MLEIKRGNLCAMDVMNRANTHAKSRPLALRTEIVNPCRIVLLSAILLAVAACSQLSQEECLYMNWHAHGVMDGVKGAPSPKAYEYQQRCDRFGVQVDVTAYEEGRQEGVQQYCTLDNGFVVGMRGDKYQNACPHDIERAFLGGYQPGRSLYLAVVGVNEAKARVNAASTTISRAESQIDRISRQLDGPDLTDDQRRELRHRIRELERDVDDAREARITYQVQVPNLIARCRTVKNRVEAQGFETNVNCY